MDGFCGCLPASTYKKKAQRDTEMSASRQVSGFAFPGNND